MMANKFTILVALTKQPEESAVYQKHDGERFASNNTIKLNVNCIYTVNVTIRPQRKLNRLHIEGGEVDTYPVNPDGDDDDSFKYQAKWSTEGCAQTKSGHRKDIPVVIEMSDGLTVKVVLQCKFYPETETEHCSWGQHLHNIEYECEIPDNCSYVDLVNTKYF